MSLLRLTSGGSTNSQSCSSNRILSVGYLRKSKKSLHEHRCLKFQDELVISDAGWHFTTCYGHEHKRILRKFQSFSHCGDECMIENSKYYDKDDFVLYYDGYDIFNVDSENFPNYIIKNIDKFGHIILNKNILC